MLRDGFLIGVEIEEVIREPSGDGVRVNDASETL